MTKEEAMKAALVMKAYAEGKQIQVKFRDSPQAPWCGIKEGPSFDWEYYDYRIKPYVLKFRNAVLFADNPTVVVAFPKNYSDYENATTFIKWAGEEQEVEVEC